MRPERALLGLARLHGVQVRHRGVDRRFHTAAPDTVVAVLGALGVGVERLEDAPALLRTTRSERRARVLPGCTVTWTDRGTPDTIPMRVPVSAEGRVEVVVELEDGGELSRRAELTDTRADRATDADESVVDRRVPVPDGVPAGVHRVHVRGAGRRGEAALIAAPRRGPDPRGVRDWGIFAPVHALAGPRRPGPGTLADLAELARRGGDHGATLLATLPLLATFLDGPVEPSPYAPVSRFAWNECYLDLDALPVGDGDRGRADRPAVPGAVASGLVDWEGAWGRVDHALGDAADRLGDRGRGEVEAFGRSCPLVAEYACFRATRERHGADWRRWPARAPDDRDPRRELRHLFGQFAMHAQLRALRDDLADRGQTIALDLPLGSHPDGFDTYRFPESFAAGASAGAPPDDFFAGGQVWGFPPLHPERTRQDGHQLLRHCLRAHLRYAGLLRLDHVMALHRLYWVPEGASGREGAYVRYPTEELYALVVLEASRAGAEIAGEDLGTVPEVVPRAMRRHAFARLYVAQAELDMDTEALAPPHRSVASVNTHDMPPFAAWWEGCDRTRRSRVLELLGPACPPDGADDPARVLGAILGVLGESRARHVLVTLEDLWLEQRPQNVPGTGSERGNWSARLERDLAAISEDPHVSMLLNGLERSRRRL